MWTCGLGAPDRYSRMNIPGTHLPTPRGWTAELAGSFGWKQFRRLGSNLGPSVSQPCALTTWPKWPVINNNTFKCGLHLTVRVCTTKRLFSEHVFIKISYCVFKIMILKIKKDHKFLSLCGLSTQSFLMIWLSQYKFLVQVSISSKTIPLAHDLKGAKTLPRGNHCVQKLSPQDKKAPPLGHKVKKFHKCIYKLWCYLK